MASKKCLYVECILKLQPELSDKKLYALCNDTLEKILKDFRNGIFYEYIRENGQKKFIGRKRKHE